jgi:hypothetical protein
MHGRRAPSLMLDALDAVLIDCRHKPISRIAGFSGRELAKQFGHRYQQRGHELGGRTTPEGIASVRALGIRGNALLLCLEEAPGDCHRHDDICGRALSGRGPIFRNELFNAGALQAALDAGPDADYETCGVVDDLIGR